MSGAFKSLSKADADASQESFLTDNDGRTTTSTNARRKVGILQLVALAYFTTAGGPFGLEVCVSSGGPLLTLIGLMIMPLLYAAPQALMTAELSNLVPENGGYVLWVFRAFGDFWGQVNAYNAALCNLFDNAIYPTLILDYYHILYPHNIRGWGMFFLKEFVVVLGLIINLRSLKNIGNLSFIVGLLVILPFTLGFVIALPKMSFETLSWGPIHHDGSHDELTWDNVSSNMALFLSTLFWCHTGWDGLGNFAGEIINPQKTYPIGVTISIFVNTISFVTAVIAGLIPKFDESEISKNDIWREGYFAIAYDQILLGLGMTIAFSNAVAQMGIYISVIGSTSRILATMGDNVLCESSKLEPKFEMAILNNKDNTDDVASGLSVSDKPNAGSVNNGNDDPDIDDDILNAENIDSNYILDNSGMDSNASVENNNTRDDEHDIDNDSDIDIEELTPRLRLLPKCFDHIDSNTHSPVVAVVAQSIIIAFFMFFDFGTLVEVSVTLNCITLVIEFAAFIYLRYKEPDAPRPYIIPGGKPVAWLITIVKITLVITVIILTTSKLGLVFWVTVVCNLGIVGLYLSRKYYFGYDCARMPQWMSNMSECNTIRSRRRRLF